MCLHTMHLTHLKYTRQWLLVYLQSCASFSFQTYGISSQPIYPLYVCEMCACVCEFACAHSCVHGGGEGQ